MAGNSGVPSPRQPGRASSSSARAAVPSGPGRQPARRDAPAQSRAPPRPRALGTRGRGRACPPPRAGCPPKRGGLEEPGLGASFLGWLVPNTVVPCYACSMAMLAAGANLVGSPHASSPPQNAPLGALA